MESGDAFMANFICESLECFFLHMGGPLDGLIAAAIAVCWSDVSNDAKYVAAGAVIRSVKQERLADEALWFFEAILSTQLCAYVWASVDGWIPALLRPSRDYTPEDTFRWLCRHLLLRKVFTVPSTEDTLLIDAARIEAALRLHHAAGRAASYYMTKGEAVMQIDSIMRTYTGVHMYLQRVSSIMIRGTADRMGLMKNVLSDIDQMEFMDEPDSQNPLIQHGGTIELSVDIADLGGRCMHQIGQGRQLLMHIETYRTEEAPESDEEDYEEDD